MVDPVVKPVQSHSNRQLRRHLDDRHKLVMSVSGVSRQEGRRRLLWEHYHAHGRGADHAHDGGISMP